VLNFSLGTLTDLGGREFILSHPNAEGHVLFGPYIGADPGRYVVEFSLALANGPPAGRDRACALIDVVSDYGQTVIAFDFVMLSDLTKGRAVVLPFDLPSRTENLEFRVYTNGVAPLLVADNPPMRARVEGEAAPLCQSDLSRQALRDLFFRGIPFQIDEDDVLIQLHRNNVAGLLGIDGNDTDQLARRIAESVGFKGDHANALYRAFTGTDQASVAPPRPVPFTSTLCQQAHFGYDQYRYWSRALKESPKFYRKQWEFVFIAQSLFERGYLTAGKKGLVFGAGQEPLPALFASFGVEILATDQAADEAEKSGWTATNQHTFDLSALNQRGICTDRMFNELVRFQPADMNAIPTSLDGQFDFCWSACALEHLGSLEHGLAFIENSMRTLRPGGIAIHTTEFNLTSNDDTLESQFCSFYRKRDIEAVVERLQDKGYEVAPIDWQVGEGFAERVVDMPPYGRGEPHIRLRGDQYDVTSIGLIIRAP